MKARNNSHLTGVLIIVCVVGFAFPLAAADPGTITSWGDFAASRATVALPAGVTASTVVASERGAIAAITNDGLYLWYGLGNATNPNTTPRKIVFPAAVTSIQSVAMGESHVLALTNDGLYAWGGNYYGNLGDGTTTGRTTPARVLFPPQVTTVTAIAAGWSHSLAVTNDGVYAWGGNQNGALGVGDTVTLPVNWTIFTTYSTLPVKVPMPAAVTSVSFVGARQYGSYALTNDSLYAWGYNYFGQLGDGTNVDQYTPAKITLKTPPLKKKGNPTYITPVQIALGEHYVVALATDGRVYSWGENLMGCLGNGVVTSHNYTPVRVAFPAAVTSVTALGAGRITSFAVTNDGLYGWGENNAGQLGLGTFSDFSYSAVPIKVPGEFNAIAVTATEYETFALH